MFESMQNMNEQEKNFRYYVVSNKKLFVLVLTSSSPFLLHTTSQIQLQLTKDGFVEINSIWRPQTEVSQMNVKTRSDEWINDIWKLIT